MSENNTKSNDLAQKYWKMQTNDKKETLKKHANVGK